MTASDKTIAKGASVLIEGTVLDMSPAQPGTPCVSKDSMATYMEYLHMQHPIYGIWHNVTVTGVPVLLLAIDKDGNTINIGTTTSDVSGTFGLAWTPKRGRIHAVETVSYIQQQKQSSLFLHSTQFERLCRANHPAILMVAFLYSPLGKCLTRTSANP